MAGKLRYIVLSHWYEPRVQRGKSFVPRMFGSKSIGNNACESLDCWWCLGLETPHLPWY